MTNDILIAILLILPGFISVYFIKKISVQEEKWSSQEFYFWSLFISVIIFSIFSLIEEIKTFDGIENFIFDYKKIALLYLLSIASGVILGYVIKRVVHGEYRLLPGQVWSISLRRLNEHEGKFVTIFTTDNLEFMGRVRLYSTREDSPREILIEEPVQIIRNDKMKSINEIEWGKEILFTESDIKRIVFYESTQR